MYFAETGNINQAWRVLAWAALMVTAILLAILVQALAAGALVEPLAAEPPAVCLSPATAALADGDDVRARLLAGRDDEGYGACS